MFRISLVLFLSSISFCSGLFGQIINQFTMFSDVKITIDMPLHFSSEIKNIIILYALPNGNTTEQTMGKKIKDGDDWHYDIQHIKAQTAFIRNELEEKNIVVAYLENNYKSWPSWKTKNADYEKKVQQIVDTLIKIIPADHKVVYLSSHSGGGRFIFSYLDGIKKIPKNIQRITFLDSDYGYGNSYLPKLKAWLKNNKHASLNVFAYNDSVALLDGKRFVSDTGGTWYRSHLMLKDLSQYFHFDKTRDDSLIEYVSADKRIRFFLKTNPDKKIFHTVQVERNGFIHSILMGTKQESRNYTYFAERAYGKLIQ